MRLDTHETPTETLRGTAEVSGYCSAQSTRLISTFSVLPGIPTVSEFVATWFGLDGEEQEVSNPTVYCHTIVNVLKSMSNEWYMILALEISKSQQMRTATRCVAFGARSGNMIDNVVHCSRLRARLLSLSIHSFVFRFEDCYDAAGGRAQRLGG